MTARELGTNALGSKATLLQFSTEVCAPCRTAKRVLSTIASERFSVKHIDLDLTQRLDLDRFSALQTPTTLILDGRGRVRARIGGGSMTTQVGIDPRGPRFTGVGHGVGPRSVPSLASPA